VDTQDYIDIYKSHIKNLNEPMVKKAIKFAIKYHGSQKRASGEAYYFHPLEVAKIIAELHLDSDSVITAILHDTIEDTDLTFSGIEKHFGPNIAKLVDGVTKLTKIKFNADSTKQAENFRKLLVAMSDDIRVLIVKLADRLHNIRTIHYIKNSKKRKRIALETMEIHAHLAERIGIQAFKSELQDRCFEVLNHEAKQSIISRFDSIKGENKDLVQKISDEIRRILSSHVSGFKVQGREKTPYSTWIKMQQKDVGIDQLSDIVAFRVIAGTITDCYKVLGIIHSTYKMIPDHFQDFISTPKNNGYRSLHTVVLGPFMQKIEIQIRTKKMHEVAEFGVAAHWRYKQNHKDLADGHQYTWIRELLTILEQDTHSEEVLQNTKLAMYYDQVFCFTPQGNIIALPKGATTVDFAYMVHSDIGNACVGAKVNGRTVPLRAELNNGDQVEIITSKNQTASPSWEKFVITGKAKSEIKKTIRSQNYDQYIKLGKNIISKALQVAGITDQEKALEVASKFFGKKKNDLLFAIGEGTITREQVIKHVQPRKSRLGATLSLLKFGKKEQNQSKSHDNLVPIKGLISGMAMHMAKCCHPLPGDKIVGIIHTGTGVTIHTSDCGMLNNFANMPERIIDLTWDSDASNIPFVCRIKIVILHEPSGLATVTSVIANCGGNLTNIKVVNRTSDYFEILFDIEVESAKHMEKIINSLRAKQIVQDIERVKY